MEWTTERKIEAAVHAPTRHRMLYDDTIVIERPGWYQVITPSSKHVNEVALSRVDADRAEAVIDEVIATNRSHGVPTKWCVGPWTEPKDFGERLARRGFTSWGVKGMASGTRPGARVPTGVRIVDVREAELDAYLEVTRIGWSISVAESKMQGAILRRARGPIVPFIALLDGACVGSAALVLLGDHAYLVGAQVLEAARGRGVYRALTTERLGFLHALGIDLAVTQAREATSAPILERLGFETLFESRCYLLDS
jgi:acetyltransferase (GNAT) family protein